LPPARQVISTVVQRNGDVRLSRTPIVTVSGR
jgi:hypothetical protein